VFHFRIRDIEHETDIDEEIKSIENKDFVLKRIPANYTIHFPNMFKLAKKLELVSMPLKLFLILPLRLLENKLECSSQSSFLMLV
jgi:hypothetical protein